MRWKKSNQKTTTETPQKPKVSIVPKCKLKEKLFGHFLNLKIFLTGSFCPNSQKPNDKLLILLINWSFQPITEFLLLGPRYAERVN